MQTYNKLKATWNWYCIRKITVTKIDSRCRSFKRQTIRAGIEKVFEEFSRKCLQAQFHRWIPPKLHGKSLWSLTFPENRKISSLFYKASRTLIKKHNKQRGTKAPPKEIYGPHLFSNLHVQILNKIWAN